VNEADALLLRAARGDARGADAVWAAARQRHRHHPLLLGVALALFAAVVVAVAAISIVNRTTDDSQPYVTAPPPTEVTATATGAELAASLTLTGSELEPGSVLTARATLTNVSSETLTVSIEPHENMRLRWPVMPSDLRDAAHRLGITGWDNGGVSFRGHDETANGYVSREAAMAQPENAELAPDESVTFDAMVDVGDRLPTGPVTFRFEPIVRVDPPSGAPADGVAWRPLSDAALELPLTVLPRPDGTLTEADSLVVALKDPRVGQWLTAPHAGWPGTLNGETSNSFGGGQRPDGYEALAVITRDRPQGELLALARELNLPGFVVRVDRQGVVTVEYLVE
jgi:hypothetical protein